MSSATDLISKTETAALLGGQSEPLSISFVNQLLAKKRLTKVRLSYRVTRITRKSVEDYIASRTVAPCWKS